MTRHKPRVYDRHLPRGFGNLPPGNLPRGIPSRKALSYACPVGLGRPAWSSRPLCRVVLVAGAAALLLAWSGWSVLK